MAVLPLKGPVYDVITVAKRDLKLSEILDGIGGFTCYGAIENYEVTIAEGLLPMGQAEGCKLNWDIPKDGVRSFRDVGLLNACAISFGLNRIDALN